MQMKQSSSTDLVYDDTTITSLRRLQILELKILLEFKRICDKYDIKYFLSAGTLLGAVRHNGIIPWDDDIDVGLMRDEYEKFISICQSELTNEYFLQTNESEPNYNNSFSKIRLNNTEFREYVNEDVIHHRGIYIDIFPYDYIPNNKIKRIFHYLVVKIWDQIHFIKCGARYGRLCASKKIASFALRVISICISKNIAVHLRDHCLRKYEHNPTQYCMNFPFSIYPSSLFNQFTELEFEGFKFPVPLNYKKYLEITYGDYMTPPPQNERKKHSPYVPNFGPYVSITIDDIKRQAEINKIEINFNRNSGQDGD